MAAPCRSPLVVILGATGTGKSKLSLELGRLFNGEIISADSMQVYKGLDIITNKVTTEEMRQCPHHVINYLSPLKQNSNIVDFRNRALPLIDSLLERKKTPIIVGGTNYYIEALLWHFLIDDKNVKPGSVMEDTGAARTVTGREVPYLEERHQDVSKLEKDPKERVKVEKVPPNVQPHENGEVEDETRDKLKIDNLTLAAGAGQNVSDSSPENEDHEKLRRKLQAMKTKELHAMLREVDSATAKKVHPHDRRKVIRALEVYQKHQVPMSILYKSQHIETKSDRAVSGPLRYTDTCIFWIQCNQEVLDARLDKRVDGMLNQGLVKELTDFHAEYNADRIKEGCKPDYTHGIFQSIGFKEFHNYLMLSEEERQTESGKQLLEKGIEDLKLVTRRYARKQIKWIKNRFLRRPGSNVPSVYGLDGTDVARWDELVTKPATQIMEALRQGKEPAIKPLPYEGERDTVYVYNECEICDKIFVLESTWKAHLSSKKHKALVRRDKILENKKRDELVQVTEILDQAIARARTNQDTLDGSSDEKDSLGMGENS